MVPPREETEAAAEAPAGPTSSTSEHAPVASEPRPSSASEPPLSERRERLVALGAHLEPTVYFLWAGACVLYAAVAFYGAMHRQTGGVWSAPLDDVFIHFDYARAAARGYPFQWTEGNGFSSGNTSLAYPFVLAIGYLLGFRGLLLMEWAALLACLSILGFLLVGGRILERVGPWAKYLLPPVALAVGALDWSLFSGMENAFHLAAWALAASTAFNLVDAAEGGAPPQRIARLGWMAGAAGALLFATRPESVVCVASFGTCAAIAVLRSKTVLRAPGRAAVATLLRVGIPGGLVLVAQSIANRVFTGEWSANGAIAKLALNNPYMTADEKWDTYVSLLQYVVVRNTEHHFSDVRPWGWIVLVLALVPFASRATRRYAVLLWVQIVGWLLLVSLNGQVRWQNERYTMPAVAWLLVLVATGLALIVSRTWGRREPVSWRATSKAARVAWGVRVAFGVTLAGMLWLHQLPRMRDQIWFFARASRNIRDQHLVAGSILKEMNVRRILVGDAGGLIYAADRPGLDLIGLGGYHDLPFARAGIHGLGASLELLERIAPGDRPDVMAIYPTWWGNLPAIFGKRLIGVPVIGNVICGGAEKVIYRADWSPLEQRAVPFSLRKGERIVDELDVADLMSERAHGYQHPRPQGGFVAFNVLPEPLPGGSDRFDAGRVIHGGRSESAKMRAPAGAGRLVARTVTPKPVTVEVREGARVLGVLTFAGKQGWSEASLDLPTGLPETLALTLTPVDGEWVDHHVWILEGGVDEASPREGIDSKGAKGANEEPRRERVEAQPGR
ncbi:hypothetical protein [Chondromyces crocatus]|uniref:Uncharacterized protein n=1 Tax=Chondromyces crocatus TaxID=52 RepID=A0A0K1E8W4_CHOCO|nr:hypothetical protein [Chondromyces crocatus]AKT37321.1 uncharacterized protein CMC5_014540 [Chondromyces crocatus]